MGRAILVGLLLIVAACAQAEKPPASAKSVNGPELEKLLVGNTLQYKVNRRAVSIFFADKTTYVAKTPRGIVESSWRITPEGGWCTIVAAGPNAGTHCRTNARVAGDRLFADGVKGTPDFAGTVIKGNSENM